MAKNSLRKEMRFAQMVDYGNHNVIKVNQGPIPHVESTHLLIKVHASSINPLDCKLRQGLFKSMILEPLPRTLGFDIAGEVVSMGAMVKHFRIGDRIIAKSLSLPGGAHADYINIPERVCAVLPDSIDYLTAAGLPLSGLTALQALRDHLHVKPGDKVLINGAGGGVGHLALQLAKIMRAEVTATVSKKQIEWATLLGADKVIDYREEPIEKHKIKYDAIFDVVSTISKSQAKLMLKPNGRYVSTDFSIKQSITEAITNIFQTQSFSTIIVRSSRMDLDYLINLVVHQLLRVQVEKVFDFSKIAQAHKYMSTKRGVGKVIIHFSDDTK
ncbi:MAG: NAD(P)-dependent alcohol dehydrogenase [Pseudomonadota bacterium]|nr:NAD(P)-dependent alcohol dehydrogenase [Pseudomonadota bacterium]